MRERLLVAFGTLILVIVALYGIPRAYLLADGVEQVQSDQLNQSADFLAELIPERASTQGVDQEYLAGLLEESERIEHLDAEGELIVEAGEQLPEHGSDIVATRELPQGQELILTRSGLHVQDSIADALTPVVVIGVGLTLSAGIVCLVMARKLSRPFQDLAAAARQLGSGRFDLEERDYKLPEAQAIGSALTNSARQLEQLLEHEREFAANASHQLRTPITALRLELEDLTYWPETPPAVSAQLTHSLGELDRLSAAVTELLELARGQRLGDGHAVDLPELLQDYASRWTRLAGERGRALAVTVPEELTAVIHEGPVAQIFDVLIENALTHGSGTVELRAEDAGTHLRLSVANEGPRPERTDLFERRVTQGSGEGIGLAVASELATAVGGTLRHESGPTTRFVLMLPQAQGRIPTTSGI